jgi:hypothetical protein
MSDRIDFEIVCPNDHNQTVTFSQKEFEEALKSGALVFHCNTCDTNWHPSPEDIAKFRKRFAKLLDVIDAKQKEIAELTAALRKGG